MPRPDFIEAARALVGTRFHHQGRAPGVGLDCAGVVICAAAAIGVALPDRQGYPRRPRESDVLECLEAGLDRVDSAEPGDVLAFEIDGAVTHLGILTEAGTVIHAWVAARRVCENVLDDEWRRRVARIYRLRG